MSVDTLFGYFTGLYFIKADLSSAMLWRTAALVHLLDAILCGLIAHSSGRNRGFWTVAGLCLGIWALAAIFVLPTRRRALENAHTSQSSCAIT